MVTTKDIARFWAKVDRTGDCWIWTASKKRFGYGRFMLHGRQWTAPRVAWVIVHGSIPEGLHILHRCDNPPCVRPDHLFTGTNADNVADKQAKGRARTAQGSLSGMAKLDEASVVAIRHAYASGDASTPQLAREYGVTTGLIGAIIRGTIWQHVGGSVRKGLARGERTNNTPFTEHDIRQIRRRRADGVTLQAIADTYSCAISTISRIVHRQVWAHIE